MIQIRDLTLVYPSGFELNVPQLDIAPGEKVAIIGPSGTGKSTLLKLIAGVIAPGRGTIQAAGIQLAQMSTGELRRWRATQIGFVFQEFELLEYLTAAENILLPYTLGLNSVANAREELSRLATALGIQSKLAARPGQLSHGERQRVALCRALISRPSLVLADEPTGSLDPVTAQAAIDVLVEQVEQLGSTLVVVTHDHTLLQRFDRTLQLPLES